MIEKFQEIEHHKSGRLRSPLHCFGGNESVITMSDNKPKLRKRKKKEYWGPIEEQAVVDYLSYPAGHPKANAIFTEKIYDPLKKLVENIMFTYNLFIHELPVDEQIYECVSFVTQKMPKFDPEKGCKSYSYYGTIAKNNLIAKKNKHYKNKISTVDIENVVGFEMENNIFIDHEFETNLTSNEYLVGYVSNEIKELLHKDIHLDPNIYKVGEAVVYLLDNYQNMSLQNKKQFYFIIKEFTGLKTKEITSAMQKLKEVFAKSYKEVKYE